MRIGKPALKHGILESDIWHAIICAMRQVADDNYTALFGPARNGALLEVGILDMDTDDPVVIHAMPLRASYYKFLGKEAK